MEATIGFDLRSTVSDPSWTVDRRTRFLLRRDVASVRSVDPVVWVRPLELPRGPQPEGLWPDLSGLFAVMGRLIGTGYQEASAHDARQRILAFFSTHLRPGSDEPGGGTRQENAGT